MCGLANYFIQKNTLGAMKTSFIYYDVVPLGVEVCRSELLLQVMYVDWYNTLCLLYCGVRFLN